MSQQHKFTDNDGDLFEVTVVRHMNRDCISILLNGLDEVVFRVQDADRVAAMILDVAQEVQK